MSKPTDQPPTWSPRQAEVHFYTHRDTISKRLRQLGEPPDAAGRFTTKQICAAVYGGHQIEKIRLTRERADWHAMDNAERRRALIAIGDAKALRDRFCAELRRLFGASGLGQAELAGVLGEVDRLATADLTESPPGVDEAE